MMVFISALVTEASGCLGCFAVDNLAHLLRGAEHSFCLCSGQAGCEGRERTAHDLHEPPMLRAPRGEQHRGASRHQAGNTRRDS